MIERNIKPPQPQSASLGYHARRWFCCYTSLGLHHGQSVAVRVPDQKPFREPECSVGRGHNAGRQHRAGTTATPWRHRLGVLADQRRLPVAKIVGASIRRYRPPVPRGQVLQELDARTGRRPERRDAEAGAKDVVQALLLRPVVLALACHSKAERIPIAAKALRGIADDDRGVVDAKEEAIAPAPLRIALAGREPQDLERVAVRVLEVKRADPARAYVPVGEALRRRRGVLDAMLAK